MPVPDRPVDDPRGQLAGLLERLYLRSGRSLPRELADAITLRTFSWRQVMAILAAVGIKPGSTEYEQARGLWRRTEVRRRSEQC